MGRVEQDKAVNFPQAQFQTPPISHQQQQQPYENVGMKNNNNYNIASANTTPSYYPQNVVQGTPPNNFVQPAGAAAVNSQWTTELFACMENPNNALITAIVPCVTFGQIAEVMGDGRTSCITHGIVHAVAPCIMSPPNRTKLRKRFGLGEEPAPDWLVHTAFMHCALCQEYRELVNRGIDPAIGYHGNINKGQNGVANAGMVVPPQVQMMNQNAAVPNY